MAVTVSQRQWINKNLSIVDYLDKVGVEIPHNGKIYCPFHHNTNTPAAKVFIDDYATGIGGIRCFTEQRSYGVYDICKTVLEYDDMQLQQLVPEEFWYTVVDVKQTMATIPVLGEDERMEYEQDVFGLLRRMDYMYRNPATCQIRKL